MARANLQIKVGSYTGNGVDNTNNTSVGFRPDLLLIKGGTTNTAYKTKDMALDSSSWLTGSNGHLSNYVQELLLNGFQLGTGSNVNTNGSKYYYVAMRGAAAQSAFRVGRYVGDGSDNRNYTGGGLNFTPDFVCTKQDGATQAVFRTSAHTGDSSSRFDPNSNATDQIQNLQSNGFQLGTDTKVNASAGNHYFWAMKNINKVFKVGSFTGDAASSRAITGLGFKPDVVIVKSNTTTGARILTSSMVTDLQDSLYLNTTASDNSGILSLDSDGFTVGSSDSVNKASTLIIYLAFRAGDFNVPLTRNTA